MSYFMDRLYKICILNYLKQHYFLSKKAPRISTEAILCALRDSLPVLLVCIMQCVADIT